MRNGAKSAKSASVLLAAAAFSIVVADAGQVEADVIAYDVPAPSTGNQDYGGSLGMDFVARGRIVVTRIGVFDSGQDGLANSINAYIYDRGPMTPTSVVGPVAFAAGQTGTLVNGSRFLDLASPLTLPAGFQGTVVAEGYSAAEPNGNVGGGVPASAINTGGGALGFVGGGRFGDPGAFPVNPDGGPANRYYAGTFAFEPALRAAYQPAAGLVGNQDAFGGSLGLDFDVNAPINVTQLGVFDSGGDGLGRSITAQLFRRNNNGTPNDPADDSDGGVLATLTFDPGDAGTLIDANRYKPLAQALTLEPGSYTMVASNYGAEEPNFNIGGGAPENSPVGTIDGSGLLSFVGAGRFGDPNAFPTNVDGGPVNRYAAGTFIFEPVPEPASLGILTIGGAALLVRRRRA
jgi:hypothetical protein